MTTILLFAASVFHSSDTVQSAADTLRTTVSGRVIVANTGFAPVPAFSFDSPLVMGFGSIVRKRFMYEPDLSAGLNGKPWMMNNWLKYKFVQKGRATLRVGVNPNLFFKQVSTPDEEIMHAQRSVVSELAGDWKFGERWTASLAYQYIRGIDAGTLRGSFIAATLTAPPVRVYKKLALELKPQVIHFDFGDEFGGTLISTTALLMHKRAPVSLYCQGVIPVWLKFESSFKWNFGLVYIF
jgi:hypothetical protein